MVKNLKKYKNCEKYYYEEHRKLFAITPKNPLDLIIRLLIEKRNAFSKT
jgi:hypothetical protein